MIASVEGVVAHVGLEQAVIEVGGVGLAVRATPATLAGLRVGERGRLSTSLIVREDSLTLMGFENDDERAVFEILQSVSGVGPKLALAVLAVHTPDTLRRAVAAQDLAALQRVPGVGKKGAQRLVLEIGEKLGPPRGDGLGGAHDAAGAGDAAAAAEEASQDAADPMTETVVEALTGLGWQQAPAHKAVTAVLEREDVDGTDTAAVLRAALQHLAGGGRG